MKARLSSYARLFLAVLALSLLCSTTVCNAEDKVIVPKNADGTFWARGWLVIDNWARRGTSYSLVFYEDGKLIRETAILGPDIQAALFKATSIGRPYKFRIKREILQNGNKVVRVYQSAREDVVR